MDAIVRVLQLTDTHLMTGVDDRLMGAHVDQLFRRVRDFARDNEPEPDLLLMTGDLAQDACVPVYHRLRDYVRHWSCPQCWLPGNHDDRAVMREAVPELLAPVVDFDHWRVVCLSTLQPGKVGGRLDDAELGVLQDALATAGGRHVLVVLHHPLVAIDAAWLDEQTVSNGAEVLALLQRYPAVKAVLGGHIHQHLDRYVAGVRQLATPSTWVQFAPGSDGFALDEIAPGYRWLELHPDGTIVTDVVRVGEPAANVDYGRGSGY